MKEHKVLQDNLETEQGINFSPHLPILNHVIFATFLIYKVSVCKNLSHNRHTLHIMGD